MENQYNSAKNNGSGPGLNPATSDCYAVDPETARTGIPCLSFVREMNLPGVLPRVLPLHKFSAAKGAK